jgi:hypothetical protein
MDRRQKIRDILNKRTTITKEQKIQIIRDKFPELNEFKYAYDIDKISEKDIVKYVVPSMSHVSTGRLDKKIYSNNKRKVILHLFKKNHRSWKIDPHKVYVFYQHPKKKKRLMDYVMEHLIKNMKNGNYILER